VIIVKAPVGHWGEGKGRWHFLAIPPEQSVEFRLTAIAAGRSVRVRAKMDDVTWHTSIFPQKSGGYILPIKAAVRAQAGVTAGDEVEVTLELG